MLQANPVHLDLSVPTDLGGVDQQIAACPQSLTLHQAPAIGRLPWPLA